MSRESRMSAGMLLILLPSVMYAGYAHGVSCGRCPKVRLGLDSGRPERRLSYVRVRGLRDFALPDEDRIDRETRDRLGEGYAEAVAEGAETGWDELAAVTLAS